VWPSLPYKACLEAAFHDVAPAWTSPVTGTKTTALKSWRFRSFPRYLVLPVYRFYLDDKWTPQKHAVEVDMPMDLDLESFRAKGRQKGEEIFQTSAAPAPAAPKFEPDEMIVMAAVSMGFSVHAGRRAAKATQNAGAEHAINWIMANMDLPDLNDPIASDTKTSAPTSAPVDPAPTPGAGSSQYSLVGMVTHQGKNSGHGHYICYTLRKASKEGKPQWALFNDRKVRKALKLPKGVAYIYLYKQK